MPDLSELLTDAVRRGLLHLSVTKMHDRKGMWQAAGKWTWSGGYVVAIESSPETALIAAMSKRPAGDALPATVSVFD